MNWRVYHDPDDPVAVRRFNEGTALLREAGVPFDVFTVGDEIPARMSGHPGTRIRLPRWFVGDPEEFGIYPADRNGALRWLRANVARFTSEDAVESLEPEPEAVPVSGSPARAGGGGADAHAPPPPVPPMWDIYAEGDSEALREGMTILATAGYASVVHTDLDEGARLAGPRWNGPPHWFLGIPTEEYGEYVYPTGRPIRFQRERNGDLAWLREFFIDRADRHAAAAVVNDDPAVDIPAFLGAVDDWPADAPYYALDVGWGVWGPLGARHIPDQLPGIREENGVVWAITAEVMMRWHRSHTSPARQDPPDIRRSRMDTTRSAAADPTARRIVRDGFVPHLPGRVGAPVVGVPVGTAGQPAGNVGSVLFRPNPGRVRWCVG